MEENIKQIWGEIANHPAYKEALNVCHQLLRLDIDKSNLELSGDTIYNCFVFKQSLNNQVDSFTTIVGKIATISKVDDNLVVKLEQIHKERGIIREVDGQELSVEHTYPFEKFKLEFDKNGIEMRRTYEQRGLFGEKPYPVLKKVERYERRGLREVIYEKTNGVGGKVLERGRTEIEYIPEHDSYFQRLDIISPAYFTETYRPPVDMQLIEDAKNSLTQEQYEGLKGLDNNGYFMGVIYQDESIKQQEGNRTR